MHPISIIIPHFSKTESLKKVHAELKLQMIPEDEVLIIDDFSPGGVPDFNCKCTRVIQPSIKLEPHLYRLNSLRNLGLSSAKHDTCVIIDPDCLPNPHFLANARACFDPAILFAGRIDYIQKDGALSPDPRTGGKRENTWIDENPEHKNGILVWGGCMMFSKSRTALIGWFDTAFDGIWGAEDHEFASRCFNSGVRLFYSKDLLVTHLYHPPNRPGIGRNNGLWERKAAEHRKHLNITTPYNPAVGACVITMLRHDLLDQCLRSIFRNIIPIKVRLIVNGDNSPGMKNALRPWNEKWAVEVVNQDRASPSKIRNDSFQWAKELGYKYLMTIDDDIVVSAKGITNLVRVMENDPNIHACAGYIRDAKGKEEMLGGTITDNRFNYLSKKSGVHDASWIGSGFTICRVDDFTPYDGNYEMGWEDPDWCMEMVKHGKRLAVCGDAGAYHRVAFTKNGAIPHRDTPEYNRIRYDSVRHERMSNLFQSKWGFAPRMGSVVDG